jgi:hypothetical protein
MSDDLRIDDLVRCFGEDEHGRNVSGMTGKIKSISPLYCDVALTCWPGVTVRVVRIDLTLVEAGPVDARRWRAIHRTWAERNRRVIRSMSAKRDAA